METENTQPTQKKNNLPGMIAALVGIAVVGSGAWFWKGVKTEAPQQPIQNSEAVKNPTETIAATSQDTANQSQGAPVAPSQSTLQTEPKIQTYADGAYSAAGKYNSPAGVEEVDVSLTLKNGKIADASFSGKATNPASKKWQSAFDAGYRALVVGKSLDELSLTAVSGASLATKGFMDAIQNIKQQAGK